MTVFQLLLALKNADPRAIVRVAYDSGCAYSDAKSVEFSTEQGIKFVYISTESEAGTVELKELLGKHVLTGVDFGMKPKATEWDEAANTMSFVLDGRTLTAAEDPDDGYRSSLEELLETPDVVVKNVFVPCHVVGRAINEDVDVVELVDEQTGKVVLAVGTADADDYYPSYVADFTPENMASNAKEQQS